MLVVADDRVDHSRWGHVLGERCDDLEGLNEITLTLIDDRYGLCLSGDGVAECQLRNCWTSCDQGCVRVVVLAMFVERRRAEQRRP